MGCVPGIRSKNIKLSFELENDQIDNNVIESPDQEVEELAPPKRETVKYGNDKEEVFKPKTPPKAEEMPSYEPMLMEKVSFPNYEPNFDFQFLDEEQMPQSPEKLQKEDINDLLREIDEL